MSCVRGSSHIIKSGDTLFSIAQQQLGDGNRWREMKKPDGSPFTDTDVTTLQVKQEICISNGALILCNVSDNDAPGHLTKNGQNWCNYSYKISEVPQIEVPLSIVKRRKIVDSKEIFKGA